MQRIARFARYWEIVGNSGRFQRSLPLLLGRAQGYSPFARFMRFADWLYAATGKTHEIALERQFEAVLRYLVDEQGVTRENAVGVVRADFEAANAAHARVKASCKDCHAVYREP